MQLALQPSLQDALSSSQSPSRAFNTFFKDSKYTNFVHDMLSNVYNGTPDLSTNYSNPLDTPILRSPLIACAFEPGVLTLPAAAIGLPLDDDGHASCTGLGNLVASYLRHTNLIMLCPKFMHYSPETIGPASDCLRVLGNRFWSEPNPPVSATHPWILMHELLHFYLQNQPGPINDAHLSSASEVYAGDGLNGLVALPAAQSLSNPDSYTSYAASRSLLLIKFIGNLISHAVLYANCTSYPWFMPCNGRCLKGEVGNTTNIAETTYPAVNSTLPVSLVPMGKNNSNLVGTFGRSGIHM